MACIGLGTRERLEATPDQAQERIRKLEGAIATILECLGEDPEREGLRGTPERYAKAMLFFTKGYEENVRDIVNGAVFNEDHDELILIKNIEIFSLCEHHMVPFVGKVCPFSGFYASAALLIFALDARWIHSSWESHWAFQTCSLGRDVFAPTPSSRTTNQASGTRNQ